MRFAIGWCLVIAAACSKQVAPVMPWWSIGYVDPSQMRDVDLEKDGRVVVGTVFTVDGGFAATCEQPGEHSAQHGPDSEGSYLYSCKEQVADITVTCQGPCTVSGTRITATGAGQLAVQVELTAHGRRAVKKAVITAVAPDGFTIGPCLGGLDGSSIAVADGATCVTPTGILEARVHAGGHDFMSPNIAVTAAGNTLRTLRGKLELARLLGLPLGSTPPGTHDVELQYGELRERVQLVVDPSAGQSVANPQRVVPPVRLEGETLASANDVDWYRFTATAADAGKHVHVMTRVGGDYCATVVEMFTGTNPDTVLESTRCKYDDHKQRSVDAVTPGATYWVKVSWSRSRVSDGEKRYEIIIKLD